jgi:hypothetical protein
VRRTDAALHPSTPLELMISRALDQELEWYFVYAETALSREHVGLLPSYAAATVLSANPTEESFWARRTSSRTRSKAAFVPSQTATQASFARCTRRAVGPKNVEAEFEMLAPVIVRLAVASDPWPARSAHAGLEDAAATRLSVRMIANKPIPMERLKTRATRLFGSAVMAYTKVRGLKEPVLGLS